MMFAPTQLCLQKLGQPAGFGPQLEVLLPESASKWPVLLGLCGDRGLAKAKTVEDEGKSYVKKK